MKTLAFMAVACMAMWVGDAAQAQITGKDGKSARGQNQSEGQAAGKRQGRKGRRGQMGEQGRRGQRGQMEGQGRGQRGGAQMIEMLFNRFDADKNGSISSSEAPDRMKQRFDQLDANGDKSISKQEFETAMSKMRGQRGDKGNAGQGKAGKGKQGQGGKGNNGAAGGKKGRRQFDPANLLKMADKNNDGEISLAEAPERMKRSFDRLDADSSGSVTAEELKAGMAKMRERGGKSKGRNKADDGKNKMPQKPKRPPFDEDLP